MSTQQGAGMIGTRQVLVLGATGGVGRATAKLLVDTNHYVIATCRTEEQQKALEADGLCHMCLQMDLADDNSIDAAFAKLQENGAMPLSGVVNCAAVAYVGALETMSGDQVEKLFHVNTLGPLHAARLAIPMLREGKGRLVMIGSVAGDLALPLLGAYSASKIALETLCDALRRELALWNIPVIMVKPAGIKTGMTDKQVNELEQIIANPQPGVGEDYAVLYERHKKILRLGFQSGVAPERVAEDIYAALTDLKPELHYYTGVEATVVSSLSKHLPDGLQDKLIKRIFPEKT